MSSPNLEKHIKLSQPFVNEYYKAVVGILVLESMILLELERHLNQFALTYQQFNILRILKGQYPQETQLNLLKSRMLHQQSDVSRLIDRLVAMELVDKKPNAMNKRKLANKLSPKGLDLIQQIDVNDVAFQSIVKKLTADEVETLNNLVGKLLADVPDRV